MVSKPSPVDIKVAIMGAKGYPYVYGGYDTLVKELGERLQARGVQVRVKTSKRALRVAAGKK